MSLDKWLKPDKEKKETLKEKAEKSKKELVSNQKPTEVQISMEKSSLTKNLFKFTLTCSNTKCKYQKTIMKRFLTDKDKLCPRCKDSMKVKKI